VERDNINKKIIVIGSNNNKIRRNRSIQRSNTRRSNNRSIVSRSNTNNNSNIMCNCNNNNNIRSSIERKEERVGNREG
jgi:hypothetical protein